LVHKTGEKCQDKESTYSMGGEIGNKKNRKKKMAGTTSNYTIKKTQQLGTYDDET